MKKVLKTLPLLLCISNSQALGKARMYDNFLKLPQDHSLSSINVKDSFDIFNRQDSYNLVQKLRSAMNDGGILSLNKDRA